MMLKRVVCCLYSFEVWFPLRVIFLQIGVDGKVSFVIFTLLSLWLPDYKKKLLDLFFCGVEI